MIIKKNKDFRRLKKEGITTVYKSIFLVYCKNNLAYSRFAWAFSFRNTRPHPEKGVRAAVWRNRLKRWARELMRKKPEIYPPGLDILVGLNRKYKQIELYQWMTHEDFCSQMEKACRQIQY